MSLNIASFTDEELIKRVREGKRDAFGLLVQRHEARVRGSVRSMLGDTAEADDVAQEVFIRFYEKMHQFRHESKLSTYLARIAINMSLNVLQKQKRRGRLYPIQDGADMPTLQIADSGADPERWELRESLQKAITRLDPDFRAVVVLRLIEGYSVQETADILGVQAGTIGSRLSRAQRLLRSWLSPELKE